MIRSWYSRKEGKTSLTDPSLAVSIRISSCTSDPFCSGARLDSAPVSSKAVAKIAITAAAARQGREVRKMARIASSLLHSGSARSAAGTLVYCYSPGMMMRPKLGILRRAATVSLGLGMLHAQSSPVLFEGARLILGSAGAPIENGAFLIQN